MAVMDGTGRQANVAPAKDKVGVWLEGDDGKQHGFVLDPADAIRTAFAMIAAAGKQLGVAPGDALGIPRFTWRIDPADVVHEDDAASLIIETAQAALAFRFDSTALSELASAASAAAQRAG